jgi:DNA polymerase III delta prime subunit
MASNGSNINLDIQTYLRTQMLNGILQQKNPTLYSILAIAAYDMASKNLPALSKTVYEIIKEKFQKNEILKNVGNVNINREYTGCILMERTYNKNNNDTDNWSDAVIDYIIKSDRIQNIYYNGSVLVPSNNIETKKSDTVEIAPKIMFKLHDLDFDDKSLSKISFVLFSYELNIVEIQNFIRECQRNYRIRLQEEMGDHLYYFDQYIHDDNNGENRLSNQLPKTTLMFEKNKFLTNRNLDNVFFEDRETLKTRIELFKNNKDWYDERGIPYTLGMMLYGEPGCGKTSTIKAVAKVLNRHIININFSRIKTSTQLKKLFYDERLHIIEKDSEVNIKNTIIHIPIDKRLYVIEDIDAMGKLVHKRKTGVDDNINEEDDYDDEEPNMKSNMNINNNTMNNMSMGNMNISNNQQNIKKEKQDPITLSTILNILDGTLEIPGRVLILTTNHPEKIDPALIRPGRIDMILHYKKANKNIIQQMYQSFYRDIIPDNDIEEIPEYYWTPAEINAILFRNFFKPHLSIRDLKNRSKNEEIIFMDRK